MIPKECKRLAEVDFPIAMVGKHALAEKARRFGTPHQLHLWWARRPLAACRAVLLALLIPDPCDSQCPEGFKIRSRQLLPKVQGKVGPSDRDLQQAILRFIGDFSNWDLSSNQTYLEVGRGLVKAAYPEEAPFVVDPFAGGGSIPLEALRLGCEVFASDLNPVACLILKAILEDIPRCGPNLGEELRFIGKKFKDAAEKALSEYYPSDPDGGQPIAYIWARTVRCEAPNCGAEIPLTRSFWLCKKANRKRALRYKIIQKTKHSLPSIEFEIFGPKSDGEVPAATVSRAIATCHCCGAVLSPERVRAQLAAQRGGADSVFDEKGERTGGARLLAVVTLKPGEQGRYYRLPELRDYKAVWRATNRLKELTSKSFYNDLKAIPDEPLPPIGTLGFRVQRYGMLEWGDLFTARQKLAFVTLANLIAKNVEIGDVLQPIISMACSKLADRCNSLVNWSVGVECPNQLFKGNAVPMGWDFGESNILSESSASIYQSIENIAMSAEKTYIIGTQPTSPNISDACTNPLPDEVTTVWFTDPPYYNAVPYADLSDFFFVWLKRALPGHPLLRDPFDPENSLTPKTREIVEDEAKFLDGQPKGKSFFEKMMAKAFSEGRRVLRDEGIGCVVFAHKTTEGWEALLSAIIKGGWVITGSWPIATERSARMRARDSAALATSVHLICRPRPEDAPIGDWGEVLQELPRRVGDWMERLQSEGIRGADLVFACIGPALEIFSRYSKVETAEGREVGLPEFLEKVWEVVGQTALEQVLGTAEAKARNSTAGALEEDARLTALFLWTLQSTDGESPSPAPSPKGRGEKSVDSPSGRGEETEDSIKGRRREVVDPRTEGRGEEVEDEEEDEEEESPKRKKQGYSLIFDVVRRFAQPLGIHLPEWEGRVIETEKGVVRLLSVKERAKQLFGEESISVAGFKIEEQARRDPQMKFDFAGGAEVGVFPKIKGRRSKSPQPPFIKGGKEGIKRETTTLDRVHAAMLLQASGQTNALRALLKAEQDRGPDFLRLANALSALYPKDSEEKRLLDAMLLAMPK